MVQTAGAELCGGSKRGGAFRRMTEQSTEQADFLRRRQRVPQQGGGFVGSFE